MVPSPLMRVPPAAFENYRERMRQHCAIPTLVDATRCLACRNPRTTSEDGEQEHRRTGVCQECCALLSSDAEDNRQNATARRNRLAGEDACQYVAIWIAVSRVSQGGTLVALQPLAEHIIAVGTGVENPGRIVGPRAKTVKAKFKNCDLQLSYVFAGCVN